MQPFAPIFHGVQNGWVTALESMTQHLSTVKAHDIILIRTGTEQVQDPQKYFTLEKLCSMKCRTVPIFIARTGNVSQIIIIKVIKMPYL